MNLSGQTVDNKYQLVQIAGEGGMATVYKAVIHGAAGFQRTVAVKHVRPEFRAFKNYIDMFIEEARVGSDLAHPNIVQVHDFVAEGGSYYLIMEWVEGIDLGAFIDSYRESGQSVPWPLVVAIGIGTLRGLGAAHTRVAADGNLAPVIHRDISPHNVLLGVNGGVKLSDFGLARARDRIASLTAPGTVKGKLSYLAPEVAFGKPNTVQSDLFGVGNILWETLTGERLFDGKTDVEIFKKIRACQIPSITDRRKSDPVPAALLAVLDTALAADPDGRFANADEFAHALGQCTRKIMIEKSVTDFIQPGEPIHVTITVGNYKTEPITNVVVTDIIPDGTTFKINSSNLPADYQGNLISFQLGDMEFQEEIIITYTLETDPGAWSKRKFLDEVSDENNTHWLTYTMGNAATNNWAITNEYPAHTGNFTWNSQEIREKCRQVLELKPEEFVFHVQGNRPALRFFHRYMTKASISGGIVEVKEVNSDNWYQVSDNMLRNGYFGLIDYLTFLAPDFKVFSGNSGNTFKDTYVDLSPWAGKDILVRFRFGTHTNSHNSLGWFIDDIEFMNLLAYNSEVCVMSDQGDIECAIAPEAGTIVDSREDPLSSTDAIQKLMANIYPNPATDVIHIVWPGEQPINGNITLQSIDGKEITTKTFTAGDQDSLTVSTENIPAGIYIVDVRTTVGRFVGKVIVQK